MRHLCCSTLLLSLLAPLVVHADAPSFSAEYELSRGIVALGRMTRELRIGDDSRYVFRSTMETRGLVSLFSNARVLETSTGRIDDAQFRPETYRYEKGDAKRDFKLGFDYAAGRVHRADGHAWSAEMPPDLLDKLAYQAQLMVDLPAQPTVIEYAIADRDKLKTYEIRNLGRETLDTALGRIDAVKVQRSKLNSKRRTLVWFAPDLGWIPVQVEHRDKKGATTVARIKHLQRF